MNKEQATYAGALLSAWSVYRMVGWWGLAAMNSGNTTIGLALRLVAVATAEQFDATNSWDVRERSNCSPRQYSRLVQDGGS